MGLAESAAQFLPEVGWQRCVVHWYRNIFSHVPSTKVREIAAMLKAIRAGENIVAARQKSVQVIEKLRGLCLTKAAELVETGASRRWLTTLSLRNTGDAFGPIIHSNAFCARSGGAPVSSARFPTANRR
jgi:transposase-like protein